MKAISLTPGTRNIRIADVPEPRINSDNEVKIQIKRVGICGTDREEASGGRAMASPGNKELVIGHEMSGRVVETGKAVTRVKPGDYAVLTVRRGCGKCLPCHMGRYDMCATGEYRERGIWGLDGYQAQYVVEHESYAVRVPEMIEPAGVLLEPLSISEKAIDEARRIQLGRVPGSLDKLLWFRERRCLVAGLGPVGLLAAMVLVLRGAEVYGLDVVDADSARPKWLTHIGGRYINGRKVPVANMNEQVGYFDFIFESAGIPSLELDLLDALSLNGVYMVTGIPGGQSMIKLPAAELIRQLVLKNQIMAGSVNASVDHFQMGVDDLLRAHQRWPGYAEKLITNRYRYEDFSKALFSHPDNEIKTVIEWDEAEAA